VVAARVDVPGPGLVQRTSRVRKCDIYLGFRFDSDGFENAMPHQRRHRSRLDRRESAR
jgi:hypothetical protein